jgi:hypothetical protein
MDNPSDNRAKAPIAAAFVEKMRAAFGDVKVLYVRESGLTLGEEDTREYATCSVIDERRADKQKRAA